MFNSIGLNTTLICVCVMKFTENLLLYIIRKTCYYTLLGLLPSTPLQRIMQELCDYIN